MHEYVIDHRRWSQKFIFGTLMLALGVIWAREAFLAQPTQWLEGVFFVLFAWYGIQVLSESFFASIKADETGLAIRRTFWPAKKVAYDEVTGIFYDAARSQMVLVTEGTKRLMFVYLYEDVQGFIKHMAAHCKQLQQGEYGT